MEAKKITVEIWSDIVCPFCIVGKRKIELAIDKLDVKDQVEIIWRSFQLAPDFPMNTSISTEEYLVQKGYPKQQVATMTAHLVHQGRQYGIDFQFDKARSFNTLNAHRLIHWAKGEGKSHDLKEGLMYSYFTEGLDLSNENNLLSVVDKVGLDSTEAKKILNSYSFLENVQEDINRAQRIGVRGVPYFLINGSSAISGAQPDAVFEQALSAAVNELNSVTDASSEGYCTPEGICD